MQLKSFENLILSNVDRKHTKENEYML